MVKGITTTTNSTTTSTTTNATISLEIRLHNNGIKPPSTIYWIETEDLFNLIYG